jgi:hypothetical protein
MPAPNSISVSAWLRKFRINKRVTRIVDCGLRICDCGLSHLASLFRIPTRERDVYSATETSRQHETTDSASVAVFSFLL